MIECNTKMIQMRPESKEDVMMLFAAIIEMHMNQPKVTKSIETEEDSNDNGYDSE
jgi:hypothetical protein